MFRNFAISSPINLIGRADGLRGFKVQSNNVIAFLFRFVSFSLFSLPPLLLYSTFQSSNFNFFFLVFFFFHLGLLAFLLLLVSVSSCYSYSRSFSSLYCPTSSSRSSASPLVFSFFFSSSSFSSCSSFFFLFFFLSFFFLSFPSFASYLGSSVHCYGDTT